MVLRKEIELRCKRPFVVVMVGGIYDYEQAAVELTGFETRNKSNKKVQNKIKRTGQYCRSPNLNVVVKTSGFSPFLMDYSFGVATHQRGRGSQDVHVRNLSAVFPQGPGR